MNQRRRSPGRICSEEGGIALEAAIAAPVFLFVLLFLIVMVRLAAVQMALHDTAAQTVRQTAAHIYPAALAAGKWGDKPHEAAAGGLPLGEFGPIVGELADWIPEPAGPLLKSVSEGDWSGLKDIAATTAARSFVEPIVREMAAETLLEPERLSVHRISLPDLKQKEEPYFSVTLEYEFPLYLPFTKRSLLLRERSEERVWISDALPSQVYSDELAEGQLHIIAIDPSPLRPGRKARVIASTDPGRKVSLSVEYKSGTSKARHLGEATADADGMVSWEWHVSGNTTPGIWELFVTALDDGTRAGMHFTVEKKQ
ncbi:TadE/TadG family type IV pilus assembly protein [Paenibacillus tarimensis]